MSGWVSTISAPAQFLFSLRPLIPRVKALSRTTTFQQPLSYLSNKFPFLNESHDPKEVCVRTVPSILFTGLLLFLAGCGSVSNNMQPSPTPTPMPTPMPSPSPVPSPSPTPAAASDAYLSTWFFTVGRNPQPQGTISVDTSTNNGAGNIHATMPANNSTFVLQFCPYPQGFSNCMNVASITTGASATVNMNFTFPVKGTFSGAFQILDAGGSQAEATGTGSTGINFKSALLPAATVTGGINQTTGNSPGIGSAFVSGTTAHITLTGALPNHTFNTSVCSLFLQTPCATLANITTNPQGNADANVGTIQPAGWSIFRISDASGVQFVTAFRVQ
jgi:hypothetical protein